MSDPRNDFGIFSGGPIFLPGFKSEFYLLIAWFSSPPPTILKFPFSHHQKTGNPLKPGTSCSCSEENLFIKSLDLL